MHVAVLPPIILVVGVIIVVQVVVALLVVTAGFILFLVRLVGYVILVVIAAEVGIIMESLAPTAVSTVPPVNMHGYLEWVPVTNALFRQNQNQSTEGGVRGVLVVWHVVGESRLEPVLTPLLQMGVRVV